ncbi:MAG: UDP-N-acetylmuramoyl-tripeptide--D-alanyl-D-alanine ligase [Actinobacteria bacterium]|nr:UDP-N-acetylmuramoyl-tripeptide--D-alanyl-D-alanine ligase [Actinomycetota bacterium]
MIAMTLAEVAGVVSGRLTDAADPGARVDGPVVFDSREVRPGGMFVAFDGANVDGHDYVTEALAAGAVAAIVTRPVAGACIVVDDAAVALGALARAVAARLPDTIVIGITGSSGKTSTKDLLAQVLRPAGQTVAPPGSFNNELGHPYTVLLADTSTRFLILETSARGVGHIRYLTSIAPPRIGVVLNVGSAHLGEFGSRAAIAAAKSELVEALPDSGVAVLNADDPAVRAMAARTSAAVVLFGEAEDAHVRASDVRLDRAGRAVFVLHLIGQSAEIELQFVGRHQVSNALAVTAAAWQCGLPFEEITAALRAARPASRWRMETRERRDGVTVINDAYNANPESVRAALATLQAIGDSGRRTWAVLGPMAELGDAAATEHAAIGRFVVEHAIDRVVAVGAQTQPLLDGATGAGARPGSISAVENTDAALSLLRSELRPGDVVLVKASRAASLERIAIALGDDVEVDEGGTR